MTPVTAIAPMRRIGRAPWMSSSVIGIVPLLLRLIAGGGRRWLPRRRAARCGRKREHEKRAAARRIGWQILNCAGKAERAIAHARVEFRVGDGAGPAADAREDGDVLLAVIALE